MSPAVAWAIVAFIGCIAAGYGFIDAVRDLRALDGYANGRRALAWTAIRDQALRFVALVIWVFVGVGYVLSNRDIGWTIGTGGLVISLTLISLNGVLWVRSRVLLRRALERQE